MAELILTGRVSRIIYLNADSGYTVAHLNLDEGGPPVVLVGIMPALSESDRIRVEGRWVQDKRFGKQLRVERFVPIAPTVDGVERYLASGAIPGVAKRTAAKLAEHFGEELADVLENAPHRLSEIKGLGQAKIQRIVEAWRQKSGSRSQLIALHSFGLGPSLANKLLTLYKGTAVQLVKTNPYRLAKEVRGIGFLTADRIGQNVGIDRNSPDRIEAGLFYFLEDQSSEGHCFFPLSRLVAECANFLGVEPDLVQAIVTRLGELGALAIEPDASDARVYLPQLFNAETSITRRMAELLANKEATHPDVIREALGHSLEASTVDLTPEQIGALQLCMENPVAVLTGGPGTGKTTVIKALIAGLRHLNAEVLLCAPTGRAAKRMTETTGMEAKTIHRLLEYQPASGEFVRNENYPLSLDALIVDEVSMIDLPLMDALVRSLPPSARLLLVGDKDQLESVGPGAVLRDLIDSGSIPIATLTQIHRQARRSLIVVNAHRVNSGQPLLLRNEFHDEPDFFVMERDNPEAAADTIVELVSNRIPPRFTLNPVRDIQVLTPMYKGNLGAANLNARLQEALNPGQKKIRKGDREFRVGDRIMQIKNNYNKEVFNGDIGFVEAIDEDCLQARMVDGRLVEFEDDDLDEVQLAYAVTVHKSQGSEYPAVLVVMHEQHHIMLRRNLLYTAITRGKQLVMCIGTAKALNRAIRNDMTRLRFTRLGERIHQHMERP